MVIIAKRRSVLANSRKEPIILTHLFIECTDVQSRVARGILHTHVRSVEQQMLQVLHVAIATRLSPPMTTGNKTQRLSHL